MMQHPLLSSLSYRIIALCCCILLLLIQGGLLITYLDFPLLPAALDSSLSILSLAVAGFLFWPVVLFVRPFPLLLLLSIITLAFCLLLVYGLTRFFITQQALLFESSLPFRILYGGLLWILLLQWYFSQVRQGKLWEEQQEELSEEKEPVTAVEEEEKEHPDRISVKDGSRIHLIPLDDILYIQASGDYVAVFTFTGQYIKEQTMKYYELHLPRQSFVRIHRSFIVNTKQLARVELYGKDNYQVALKNGVTLRASLSGYKRLKEILSL